MEFSSQDIRRIYGSTFFLVNESTQEKKLVEPVIEHEEPSESIPEEKKESPKAPVQPVIPESNPLEKFLGLGPMTNWKLKPNSTLALIVLKSEFNNRDAMANLKNLVVNAGIDTSRIGFGVVEDGQNGWNFSDMPVDKGILFLKFPEKLPSPSIWKDKLFYPAAPMDLIMNDERYAKAMDRLLKRVQETI